MNFVFQQYPQHPWVNDWSFEPCGFGSLCRQKNSEFIFQSKATIGHIASSNKDPEWTFQIPIPPNFEPHLLANGFCAYCERRKKRVGAEIFCPEPGVLWGRTHNLPDGILSDSKAEPRVITTGDQSWFKGENSQALLIKRNETFCLITIRAKQEEAVQLAESYLNTDLERFIENELSRRQRAAQLIEEMPHHDSLTAICIESMIKALRPAEGRIPHLWSQSANASTPWFDINELFPLAQAWSLIDPEVAEELLLCVLKTQSNTGALPTGTSPSAPESMLEAPKPLMAKTVEKVWNVRKKPEWLKIALPLLRRHIQWMLHHFDPKRNGVYKWQNRNEPIDRELDDSNLISVDLTALLLTEIEAINRLQTQYTPEQSISPWFSTEHSNLTQTLFDQFWNPEESLFSNAYRQNQIFTLHGFPEIVPLLWLELPQAHKNATINRIRESEFLPELHHVLSWKQSSLEEQKVPTLQQFVVIEALKTADPNSSLLNDFSRLTLQRFVEWHALSLESSNPLRIDPSRAALILNIQSLHKYRYYGQGPLTGPLMHFLQKVKADRNDFMIIAATLFILACVRIFYHDQKEPPILSDLQAELNYALSNNNAAEKMESCRRIINFYPDSEAAGYARLTAATQLLFAKEYKEAETLLKEVRKQYPDSPSAMISLGLAQQLQGKYNEADKNYEEFNYYFEIIYPAIVKQIALYRSILKENRNNQNSEALDPPKWEQLYRYRFMHEIEYIPVAMDEERNS